MKPVEFESITIEKEDVAMLLQKELCRLRLKYGPPLDNALYAFCLPPKMYKCFEIQLKESCRIFDNSLSWDGIVFQGIKIFISPIDMIIPIFKDQGWGIALKEEKMYDQTKT